MRSQQVATLVVQALRCTVSPPLPVARVCQGGQLLRAARL